MQTYYDLGYLTALEKLGMVEKDALAAAAKQVIPRAVGFVKNLFGRGARLPAASQAEHAVRALEGTGPKAFGQALPANLKAAPALSLEGAAPLKKDLTARIKPVTSETATLRGPSIAPAPAAAPGAATPPPVPAGAGKGKTAPPVVQSPTTPAAAGAPAGATPAAGAAPAAAGTPATTEAAGAAAAKKEPGILSKYKWPIAGGVGLAGLGGYAYLKNRDPMGSGYPIQGY